MVGRSFTTRFMADVLLGGAGCRALAAARGSQSLPRGKRPAPQQLIKKGMPQARVYRTAHGEHSVGKYIHFRSFDNDFR